MLIPDWLKIVVLFLGYFDKCQILTHHFCKIKKVLRVGESNPGRPRDRREYSPLYYRGLMTIKTMWTRLSL